MIRVTPRASGREDRAGDPLDGLVNLFDLGIVLSVGFLLAALSALGVAGSLSDPSEATRPEDAVVAPPDAEVSEVPDDGQEVVGRGEQVGSVYRLRDGRLIYVVPPGSGEDDGAGGGG